MTYNTKVGSFNIDTAKTLGQTQSITGVGFQPKIVLFWWSGGTSTGDEVTGADINLGFGAAISSSSRFCVGSISMDGLAISDCRAQQRDSACIYIYSNATPTLDGAMDFSSMDIDGFTLIVDDQFANAYRISYLALGGTDLTDVYIGNKARPVVTGNYDVTDAGFQPDCLITVEAALISISGHGAVFVVSIGMATGSSNQGAVHGYSGDAADPTSALGYGYNGACASLGATAHEAFVSFIENGFTLNHLEGTTAYVYYYICLKGGQYKVHELTTRTDSNDIVESDVGFQPKALLFASANRALSTYDTRTNHNRLSIGAGTSASERACAATSDEHGLSDTETARANYDSAVYAHVVDDAIAGLMDIKSIDAGGFTCVMDDTDPSGCWVTYLAIGAESGEGCVNVLTTTETVVTTTPVVVVDWCEP